MLQKNSSTRLTPGKLLAGIFAVAKIPLFFAPFVLLHDCTGNKVYSGEESLTTLLSISWAAFSQNLLTSGFFALWALPFLLIPLGAILVLLNLFLNWRAKITFWIALISFAGLLTAGWTVGSPSRGSSDQPPELLWGFWGLFLADVMIIIGAILNLRRITFASLNLSRTRDHAHPTSDAPP